MKKKTDSKHTPHHDYQPEKKRLNRVRGQVEGVQKMIDDHRYCPEIISQIRAARAALRSIESSILEKHLRGCVRNAIHSRDPIETETKIRELVQLFGQMKE
jgi:DNA-binding FrmR family transcriptional regulator